LKVSTFPITIFHTDKCATSRNALAMIRAAGYEPEIVDYQSVGWTRAQLETLLHAMGARPRVILREKGTPAVELGLLDPSVSDESVLDAMIQHPILVNRPLVVTPKGVRLARPSQVVYEILEHQPDSFTKEDGEVVRLNR
jgi:arsenate reductase (glutaredoxin)